MNVFCNFAFKRQKPENYIILTTAFYADKAMKHLIGKKTEAFKMWENQQYVCAVQSYEYALNCIYEEQYEMKKHGVDKIWLITANSALLGWIASDKNAKYRPWMNKARAPYIDGGKKYIYIDIGALNAVDYDPAYKYCKVQNITNEIPFTKEDNINKVNVSGVNVFDILNNGKVDIKKDKEDSLFI